jgi:hypothetical protein
MYLALEEDAPGKAAAVELLLQELGGMDGVNQALGTDFSDQDAMLVETDWTGLSEAGMYQELASAFLSKAADRYFEYTTESIRAVDPDHLILGNREVSVMTPAEVYQAAAPFVDVLSINNYVFIEGVAELALSMSGGLDPANGFIAQHELTGRPILISEFGFRAADSGLPNSWPPQYPTFETQAERTQAYTEYVSLYRAVPWVVGWHWFEWVDQPAEGRFDGENNGLVSEQDVPYLELTSAMGASALAGWEELLIEE